MIEKLVESWLDSANERTFHIPFCQALAASRHAIIYVSPHGKDVISRDAKGGTRAPIGRLTYRSFYAMELSRCCSS